MERIFLVGVVVFVTLFGSSGVYAEQLVMVTPSAMNFRTEPSADSEQVSDCPKLYFGAVLTVYEEQGDWYQVEDMYGHSGWARAVYEDNVYLKDLPDDYLTTHISAKEAYDKVKSDALEWAEDAYLVQILARDAGWNGLAEEWFIRFFAPSKLEPNPEVGYPGIKYLEYKVTAEAFWGHEDVSFDGMDRDFTCIVSTEPLSEDFADSIYLFTPDKIVVYHGLKMELFDIDFTLYEWLISDNMSILYLSEGSWKIISPGRCGIPRLILDAESGEFSYFVDMSDV